MIPGYLRVLILKKYCQRKKNNWAYLYYLDAHAQGNRQIVQKLRILMIPMNEIKILGTLLFPHFSKNTKIAAQCGTLHPPIVFLWKIW